MTDSEVVVTIPPPKKPGKSYTKWRLDTFGIPADKTLEDWVDHPLTKTEYAEIANNEKVCLNFATKFLKQLDAIQFEPDKPEDETVADDEQCDDRHAVQNIATSFFSELEKNLHLGAAFCLVGSVVLRAYLGGFL